MLVLAFLAFFTVTTFAATKEASVRGKVVVLVVVFAIDALFLAIAIARYGEGVWFPSDSGAGRASVRDQPLRLTSARHWQHSLPANR